MLCLFADSFKSDGKADGVLPHNLSRRSAIHGALPRSCNRRRLATSSCSSIGQRIRHALGKSLTFFSVERQTGRQLSGQGSGSSGVRTTRSQSTGGSQTGREDVEYAESLAASTLGQDQDRRGLGGEASYAVPAAQRDDIQAADFRISDISSVCSGIRSVWQVESA